MPWGDDPTDQTPIPPQIEHHTHHHAEKRGDAIAFTLIVLATFILGSVAVLGANYSLARTVDRLLSVPMCQEGK